MQNTAVTSIHQGLWIEAYWIRCVVGEPGLYARTACSMVALGASDENHSSLGVSHGTWVSVLENSKSALWDPLTDVGLPHTVTSVP